MTTPSPTNTRRTAASVAPIARMMPISRDRSTTFIVIVPVRPRPPTTPSSTAIAETTMMSVSNAV
jgi:hypothetical protein